MRKALAAAELAKGLTTPNPTVGAVIVKDKKIIATGYHTRAGAPHAEVEAIKKLSGNIPPNAEIYVTLEPCSHYGKTPPCADLLVSKKFKRVIVGVRDANPLVSGRGIAKLRANNIEVTENILADDCYKMNEDFFFAITNKTPFVSVKCAMTLDGHISTITGDSKWITNEKSREYAHYLRKINSAVLVGANTINIDNPSLDIRLYKSKLKQKSKVIIVDENLRISSTANVITANGFNNLIIFTSEQKFKTNKAKFLIDNGATVIAAPLIKTDKTSKRKNLDMKYIFEYSYNKLGLISILVEGGAAIINSIISNKLAQKLYFFYAPKLIGAGLPVLTDILATKIKDAITLKNVKFTKFDDNIMIEGYF